MSEQQYDIEVKVRVYVRPLFPPKDMQEEIKIKEMELKLQYEAEKTAKAMEAVFKEKVV